MRRAWLHGFTGSPETFAPIAGEDDARPALYGHGPTGARAPSSFEEEVDRLAATLEPPTHLVGYSLGGRVALGIAARHGHKVGRLTLIGAHPGLREAPEREARARADDALADSLERDGIEAFVDAWERLPLFETDRLAPSARERVRKIRLSHDACTLAAALRVLSLGRMPPRHESLASLQVPVDLVVGARDSKFVAIARELAQRCPTARIHEVDDVAHDIPSANPGAIRAIVEAA